MTGRLVPTYVQLLRGKSVPFVRTPGSLSFIPINARFFGPTFESVNQTPLPCRRHREWSERCMHASLTLHCVSHVWGQHNIRRTTVRPSAQDVRTRVWRNTHVWREKRKREEVKQDAIVAQVHRQTASGWKDSVDARRRWKERVMCGAKGEKT